MALALALMVMLSATAFAADTEGTASLGDITWQEVLEGIAVTVTDQTTQAVGIGSYDWGVPIENQTYYFFDADGNALGSISGTAYLTMNSRAEARCPGALSTLPGGSAGWYAQIFNDYRGVTRLAVDEYLNDVQVGRFALDDQDWTLLGEVFAPGGAQDPAQAVIELANQERVNAGLEAVAVDQNLMSFAAIRAQEMAELFSHTRPNGEPDSTMGAPDYPWIMCNNGMGYLTPESAVEGWMNSPGHRRNMLYSGHDRVGAACYHDDRGTYWCIIFYADGGRYPDY